MDKENIAPASQSQSQQNTDELISHAHNLINKELRNDDTNSDPSEDLNETGEISILRSKACYMQYKPGSIKDARNKIREEWDALKNSTMFNDTPTEFDINTQLSQNKGEILYGVVAYIEIPNKCRIGIFKSMLTKLGATVKDRFTQEVTHVVFKDGSLETYKRAKLLNVHLVSILWIEACKNSKAKICEKLFPVHMKNEYTNSPRMFRKFMTLQKQCLAYDESSGIIYRKTKNPIQSIARNMKNLNVNSDSSNTSNENEELNQSNKENLNKSTNSNTSTDANSSAESITLRLSLEASQKINSMDKQTTSDAPLVDSTNNCISNEDNILCDNRLVENTTKLTIRRKLLNNPKHASFVALSSADNSQNRVSLVNPYKSPTGKDKSKHVNRNNLNQSTKPQKEKVVKNQHQLKENRPQHNFFKNQNKLHTVVTTYFHSQDNKIIREIINKLGGFNFKLKVDKTTTHVIAGDSQRTLNILKGMARGCWILDKKWIFDSANAGRWLTEQRYELIDFSKIVRRCRIQKQAFGKNFSLDIFDECGIIYVSRNTAPPYRDLEELVLLCKGKLTSTISNADIIVGEVVQNSDTKCVSTEWVLNSITFGRCKSISSYYLN